MAGLADVATSAVSFGAELQGFLAVPPGARRGPGVILLHERYGLVQHTRDLARRFARDGYLCLAPDLFSDAPAEERGRLHRGEARRALADPVVARVLDDAIDWLRGQETLEVAEIAIMGVCQTGRYPLVAAARRPDVAASLVFYGAAQGREWEVTEGQPEPLEALIARGSAPVLGVFGELDHAISVADVRRLREALERHGKSHHIEIFPDAPHGWLNDTMPGRYRREQAEAAWRLMHAFLEEVLGGAGGAGRVRSTFKADVSATYDFSKNRRLE